MYGICTQVKPVNAHLNTSSSALAAAMGKNRETASRQTRYYTAVAAHGVAETTCKNCYSTIVTILTIV